jgi:hypothetical protein
LLSLGVRKLQLDEIRVPALLSARRMVTACEESGTRRARGDETPRSSRGSSRGQLADAATLANPHDRRDSEAQTLACI